MRLTPKILVLVMLPVLAIVFSAGWLYHWHVTWQVEQTGTNQLVAAGQVSAELLTNHVDKIESAVRGVATQQVVCDLLQCDQPDDGIALQKQIGSALSRVAQDHHDICRIDFSDPKGNSLISYDAHGITGDACNKQNTKQPSFEPFDVASDVTTTTWRGGGHIERRMFVDHHDGLAQPIVVSIVFDIGKGGRNAVAFATRHLTGVIAKFEHNDGTLTPIVGQAGRNEQLLTARTFIPSLDTSLVFHQQRKTAVAQLTQSLHTLTLTLTVITIVMLMTIYIGLRVAVVRPLNDVLAMVGAFEQNKPLIPPVMGWKNEIGRLSNTLYDALTGWRRSREQLQQLNVTLEQRVQQRTSELKVRELQLEQAIESSEQANRAKSAFLANMSHEIRTPMTAILGFAELLEGDELIEQERKLYTRTIRRNGDHLLRLLNDILDLSKIEAGRLELEQVEVSVKEMIEEIATTMRLRAEALGLSFEVVYESPLPPAIQSDPVRLRQILVNLVGNALKFTEAGGITMQACYDDVAQEGPRLQIKVIDTGIGMTGAQQSKLFEPFTQADESTTRRYGGTGLGLSISRRIADAMEGQLTVDSAVGEGSCFTLTIPVTPIEPSAEEQSGEPVAEQPETPVAQTLPNPNGRHRILLAEDGEDNQVLITRVLKKAGYEVDLAHDGNEAVAKALKAIACKRPYDLILMDIQMPVMDGYEATKKLRSAGYTMPIIALTAHAMSGDEGRCIDAGCDGYATKPINREQLIRHVQMMIAQHEPNMHSRAG